MEHYEPRKTERIRTALVADGIDAERATEISFHLTDWYTDLVDLHKLLDEIDQYSDEQIGHILMRFLAHVPNHVAAAKKLIGLGPIEDVFGVGILEDETSD